MFTIQWHKIFAHYLTHFLPLLNESDVVQKFEQQFAGYCGTKHCIAFPMARVAIYYALKAQNFPSGLEILMPPITIKAVLDVVLELDLKPVFVDIDPETLCFDIAQLKEKSTDSSRAVLITYFFGIVPDMQKMISTCQERNLFVIEDFSQCLNGKFEQKKVGAFGDVGVYSASPTKTLDIYGGGLLISNDDQLYEKLLKFKSELLPYSRMKLIKTITLDLVRNPATSRLIFHLFVFQLLRFISVFKRDKILKQTGDRKKTMIASMPDIWFASFTSFQAMLGLKLLDVVNHNDQQRIANVEKIKSTALKTVFPAGVKGGEYVYWQLIAYFHDTKKIQEFFHSKKIDVSSTSLAMISNLEAYPGLNNTELKTICDALNAIDYR